MSNSSISKLIQEAEFENLAQNVEDHLKNVESMKQIEQIFGLCSHFFYNNKIISEEQLSSLMNFLMPLMNKVKLKSEDENCIEILKSLYYILCIGVRKGLNIQMTLKFASEMEIIIHSCRNFYANHPDLLKKMYYTLWNYSLEKGTSPTNALALQSQALGFLALVCDDILDVCNFIKRVGKLAENSNCSLKDINNMYNKIFAGILLHLKTKPSIQNSSIIALNHVVIEYAQNLLNLKTCNEFSKIFKPLAALLEPLCEPKVILSFKISVKTVEASLAYINRKCKKEILLNLLNGCNVISTSTSANTILVDGLLAAHHFLQLKNDSYEIPVPTDIIHAVFCKIIERISKEKGIGNESLLKVLEVIGNNLNELVTNLVNNGDEIESLFAKETYYTSILPKILSAVWHLRGETQIYNIGINCCNLGVIAFKAKRYLIATEYLDSGIKYLNSNSESCDETQKKNIMSILKKKAVLLKDSLRYHGLYKQSVMKTFYLVFLKLLPVSDLVSTWIKCKRDSHKANCTSLKKICIKDIYIEVKTLSHDENSVNIDIEELVLDELKELQMFSYNSAEDQLACCRSLKSSNTLRYVLEGMLAHAKVLWVYPEFPSQKETPMEVIHDASLVIEKYLQGKSSRELLLLEYRARCSLWLYFCNLEIIQKENEAEMGVKHKDEEPLTVQSTDMGEEVQPHDICSIRPSSSVTTFATQEKALKYVHEALQYWSLMKIEDIQRTSVMCNDLLSIGIIYKLRGVLPPCIKAFALLLEVANKHGLTQFWINGVKELMEMVPELISLKVANRLKDLLMADTNSTSKFPENLRISSLSSLAYYYFKNGQFKIGAQIIQDCISSSLMEKRTTLATEAQIGIFLIASCYASLPPSLLPEALRPKGTCLILALNATRKAIGLMNVAIDCNYHDNLGWHHKVAWLHHITCMWLGQLCQITAQPRIARAYLRQAFALAEKLALPLRTVELLCKLSETDLLCDQLDDCRVKVDSLSQLLRVHVSSRLNEDILNPGAKLKKRAYGKTYPSLEVQNLNNSSITIHSDGDYLGSENMRDRQTSPDFELKTPSLKLGNQLFVIGEEKNIENLAQLTMNQCPSSPNFLFGEENMVKKSLLACPKKVGECDVCTAPELLTISVKINICLGIIQAQKNNTKSAHLCFIQAQEDLQKILRASSSIVSKLCTILSTSSTQDIEIVNENITQREQFINSQIDVVNLSFLFGYNEVLCMEKNYESMSSQIVNTKEQLSDLSFIVLATNHHLVVQLILQCHAIMRAISKRPVKEDLESDVFEDNELESSPTFGKMAPSQNLLKTPSRTTTKLGRNNKLSSLGSSTKPHLSVMTPFRIFSDDEQSPICENKSSNTVSTLKGRKIQKLTSSFGKLNLDSESVSTKSTLKRGSVCSPRLSPSRLNESPFSKVLMLPDAERRTADCLGKTTVSPPKNDAKEKEPLKINSKLRKQVTKTVASRVTQKEEKENSPIIKLEIKPVRVTRGRKVDKRESSPGHITGESVRETRSRRNCKRL